VDCTSLSDLNHENDHHIILNCEYNPKPPYPMRVNRNALVSLQFFLRVYEDTVLLREQLVRLLSAVLQTLKDVSSHVLLSE